MSDNEWTAEPAGKPWNAETLLQIAAVRPDLIPSMHAVLKPTADNMNPEQTHVPLTPRKLPPPAAVFKDEHGQALEDSKLEAVKQNYDRLQLRIADLMAKHLATYVDVVNRALDAFDADSDAASTTVLDCLGRENMTAAIAARATAAVLAQTKLADKQTPCELHSNTSLHLCMTKIRQAVAVGWNMVMVPVLEHQYDATVAELTALGYTVTSSSSNNIDKRRWTRIVW